MGLSAAQQFLVEATRAAGLTDYFRWQSIGATIGLSPAESDIAVQSLGDRKLIIRLLQGDARLLDAGRQLAARLEAKTGGAKAAGGKETRSRTTRSKTTGRASRI